MTDAPFLITDRFVRRINEITYFELPYNLLQNEFLKLLCTASLSLKNCCWIAPKAINKFWVWFRRIRAKLQAEAIFIEKVRTGPNMRTDQLEMGSEK